MRVPVHVRRQLIRWSADFAGVLGNFQHDPDRTARDFRSVAEMTAYFREHLRRQLVDGGDGLLHVHPSTTAGRRRPTHTGTPARMAAASRRRASAVARLTQSLLERSRFARRTTCRSDGHTAASPEAAAWSEAWCSAAQTGQPSVANAVPVKYARTVLGLR